MVEYIDCRAKQDSEDFFYHSITAEYIAILGTGKRSEKFISYSKEILKMDGKIVEDMRTGREIIEDTFKKHNLKIAEGNQ